MTKLKLFIIAIFTGSILISCFPYYETQQSSFPSIIQYASEADDDRYETRTKRDKDRNKKRYGDSCYDHKDCEDICEDVYEDIDEDHYGKDNEGWVELCLDLNANMVEDFERVIDYLSEPSPGNMKIIEEKYLGEFETMIEISIAPFVTIVKDLINDIKDAAKDVDEDDLEESREQAKDLLSSIARESDFAQAIKDASYTGYNNYEEIKDLVLAVYETSDEYEESTAFDKDNKCNVFKFALCKVGSPDPVEKFKFGSLSNGNVNAEAILDSILKSENCSFSSKAAQCW